MLKKTTRLSPLVLVTGVLFAGLVAVACTPAPAPPFASELESIATQFYQLRADTSSDKSMEARAIIRDLASLAEQYPERWEVVYWLGFVHSIGGGMVVPSGLAYIAQLDSAHLYLDRVLADGDRLSAEAQSEVFITKANAYQLKSWQYPKDGAAYSENDSLARAYISRAEQANPTNPKVNVLRGIPMIYNNDVAIRDEGRAILEEGLEKYAAYQPENPHYPVWGEGLIQQHMARIFGAAASASE